MPQPDRIRKWDRAHRNRSVVKLQNITKSCVHPLEEKKQQNNMQRRRRRFCFN